MPSFTLDDPSTREGALADPADCVAGIDGPAFIDEIHRAPDLLLELKKAVDQAGSLAVLVLDPSRRLATVYRGCDQARAYSGNDTLDLGMRYQAGP